MSEARNNTAPSSVWKSVLRFGLVGGAIALYFCMVGMVAAFDQRFLVAGQLTLGDLVLYVGPFLAGLSTARALADRTAWQRLLFGLLAGAVAALPSILIMLFSQQVNIGAVFVSLSSPLINILTFGRGLPDGLPLLVGVFGLLGLLGAAYTFLSQQARNAVNLALLVIVTVALFSDIPIRVIEKYFSARVARAIFQGNALLPLSAVVLSLLTVGLSYFGSLRAAKKKVGESKKPERLILGRYPINQVLSWALVIAFLLVLPQTDRVLAHVMMFIGLYVMMGLGLNIEVGFAGLLDLGYVAIFAFGAYTIGILTTQAAIGTFGLSFWVALPIAVIVGVVFGALLGIPVLRMRGDYLAIVTLGFGEIIRLLALSDWLSPLVGGAQGIVRIPSPSIAGFDINSPERYYYLVLIGVALTAFLAVRLRDSRLGRQWMAMREDEDVAQSMGIDLVQTKLLAFAIGSASAGFAGAIFAARLGGIFPHSFSLIISITVLSAIIIGGFGSIPGVIVGAAVLVGLPELLREFNEYRFLIYGILLVVMMLTRPAGLLPTDTFKRELESLEEGDEGMNNPVSAGG
ncbi:MAG: hypothetical protein KIS85_04680 [Anaerolineales bacterium]|nr:hypothetical protein [Anaerolineales bacterium]